MTQKINVRMAYVLKRMPCLAVTMPISYRTQLRLVEKAGLATCDSRTYMWSLTSAGKAAIAKAEGRP